MAQDIEILEPDGSRSPDNSILLIAKIVYILHGISIIVGIVTGVSIIGAFLFGWPSIAAVVLNYAMQKEAKSTYVASHFSWQIRTFWYAAGWSVLVAIIGTVLAPVFLIGFGVWTFGFIVMGIWVGYRIIRGWIKLARSEAIE